MTRVQDWRGNTIEVGTKCLYGSDPEQRCEVIELSEPDVVYNPETDADDGGYALWITVRFDNGETEKVRANALPTPDPYDEPGLFEEGGDLEVITKPSITLVLSEELKVGDEFWGDLYDVPGNAMFWRVIDPPPKREAGHIIIASIEWADGGRDSRAWNVGTPLRVRRAHD